MSEYKEFIIERSKMDVLIQKGYRIKRVTEHLNGASIEFELTHPKSSEQKRNEVLHIQTAEGRKYFSSLILQQQHQM
ncbi:hypothetical protein [Bacillus sp. 165]|uniref:hypothetical protein n=1 Tax=Bacillus sp. 165 TaxID=1529117 RepID=UPI001ADBEEE0|nr:hypothetical protein [Bacillus sp. 165]MBO9128782.1 hypothetical protein [Bacillus sp. 165]